MKSTMARSLIVAFFICLQACFVTPLPNDDYAKVFLSIGVPPSNTKSDTLPVAWDSLGIFHLDLFEKFVRVAVETKDYELESGTWPDEQMDIGAGEGTNGEVVVALQVPLGMDRRIKALGFLVNDGQVEVYRESSAPLIDLESGKTADVSLDMVKHDTGTLDIVVLCKEGNAWPWIPMYLLLIDAKAQVAYPLLSLDFVAVNYFKVTISNIPVERPYWARIFVNNSTTQEQQIVNMRTPTFGVTASDLTTEVNLSINCKP